MEEICEFMGLVKSDLWLSEKANFTTKDYTLHQFQCYIWRQKDLLSPRQKNDKEKKEWWS